jgi:ATP-dependent RNA circularization protein (DNA/RNA ligase family)
MIKYPKIETVLNRKENFKVGTEIRCKEFENINKWLVTEKIDGTNVRVVYQPVFNDDILEPKFKVIFKGRTDNAQMPTFLLEKLQDIFTVEKFKEVIGDGQEPEQGICLYGEGYGAKIQKGGGDYNSSNSIRLFDVWIDGWWLEWDKVCEIAEMMGVKTAPVIGEYCLDDAINLISTTDELLQSGVAYEESKKEKKIEGIVARAYPTMLFRSGIPIKWKLKYSDY